MKVAHIVPELRANLIGKSLLSLIEALLEDKQIQHTFFISEVKDSELKVPKHDRIALNASEDKIASGVKEADVVQVYDSLNLPITQFRKETSGRKENYRLYYAALLDITAKCTGACFGM